jgi:hypothetical protein
MSLTGIDPNYTLPAQFYTSTDIFEEELEKIFYSRWIYVACEADVPKPGDYVALKIGKRSFFLQRADHLPLPQLDVQPRRKIAACPWYGARISC